MEIFPKETFGIIIWFVPKRIMIWSINVLKGLYSSKFVKQQELNTVEWVLSMCNMLVF